MPLDEKGLEKLERGPMKEAPGRPAAMEAGEGGRGALSREGTKAHAEQAKLRAKISLAQAQRDDRAETVQALGGKAASVELANLIEGSGTNPKIPAAALEGLIAEAFETSRNE